MERKVCNEQVDGKNFEVDEQFKYLEVIKVKNDIFEREAETKLNEGRKCLELWKHCFKDKLLYTEDAIDLHEGV